MYKSTLGKVIENNMLFFFCSVCDICQLFNIGNVLSLLFSF